jgi:hypothetical protein
MHEESLFADSLHGRQIFQWRPAEFPIKPAEKIPFPD